MERIKKLCAFLDPCKRFADVGCDHGYCTKYMLDNGLCESAVISDISEKCLSKAVGLLKNYIDCGKVFPVCAFGLDGIECDEALIAGMGGEEIVSILKEGYIPEKFVLQPMRNEEKVRKHLLDSGAEITSDKPFEVGGKFYFVIKGVKNGKRREYSPLELALGKDYKSPETQAYIGVKLKKALDYSQRAGDKLQNDIQLYKEALTDEMRRAFEIPRR